MSVVNQMLRDLEGQQQSSRPLNMQAVSKSKRPLFFILSTLVVLSLIMFLFWQYGITNQPTDLIAHHTQQDKLTNKPTDQSGTTINNLPPKINLASSANASSSTSAPSKTSVNSIQPTQLETAQSPPASHGMQKEKLAEISSNNMLNANNPVVASENKVASNNDTKKSHTKALKTDLNDKNSQILTNSDEPNVAVKTAVADAASNLNKSNDTSPKAVNQNNSVPMIQQSQETLRLKSLQQIQSDSRFEAFSQTQQRVNQLLQQDPEFHQARLFLINHAIKNQFIELPKLLQQSVDSFPQISAYRLTAARYYFENNQFELAENILLDLNLEANQITQLLQIRALARQKLEKHQLAIGDYSKILQDEPNRGDIYLALGISFDALGDFVQAKRSFQNALSDRRLNQRQAQFAESKINQYQG
ncbi:hypothetical protein FLL45_17630 [Aliikangiella marina]|uniref:Uncharacterized protein n=1 Tax=Aliikangiella marina TaxID=1712262 RepID=A0A545T490_9GAMM|nr:hypothetical protein [Aliikangiella marina]TQV71991.1 hypothetical protein FLL45_17350 [Aliikangiella marina]TQV72044.1 hypothetical protein FLL45_17630 [Aliikangiella marina]